MIDDMLQFAVPKPPGAGHPISAKREGQLEELHGAARSAAGAYTPSEIEYILAAWKFSCELFNTTLRVSEPDQHRPLLQHTGEVGALLQLVSEKPEVVAAGYLHDAFEGYVPGKVADIAAMIGKQFGARVAQLIEAVTEPSKSATHGNWEERKSQVLDRVIKGDRDLATLFCATKISILSEGNRFLQSGAPISQWSAGSAEDNLRMFHLYLAASEEKGVNEVLLNMLRDQIEQFAVHARH